MRECNTATTPIDLDVKMDNYETSKRCNIKDYQELMGRLMFLSAHTRPDISYALNCLSQFNTDPREMHMTGLKRVLRYLRGTIDYQLTFGNKCSRNEIVCETDASWDKTRDAKSFTGVLIYRNSDLIFWKCKKQTVVALSSTESEMEAMIEGVKEVIWTDRLLNVIGLGKELRKEVRCNSLNAVKLANGGNFKTKSKLLNRKCYFIKEAVKRDNMQVLHVPSDRMKADCLTKALSGPNLLKNVKGFMDVNNK
ncbi:secreted RxLR effector protein 161-like [Colletes gigas]|uniref:secreted RxLR effector protein 161-like n=1 Tax=Colletes gigas TaxID=935657 RepID=UPI001C9B1348|nr:secreted RxLR effector protein 161-like [Colletes gigas]